MKPAKTSQPRSPASIRTIRPSQTDRELELEPQLNPITVTLDHAIDDVRPVSADGPVRRTEDAPNSRECESTAAVDRRIAELTTLMQQQLQELERRRHQSLEELQLAAVELAAAAAAHVLGVEIEAGRFDLDRLVTAAVARLESSNVSAVHLHPDDLALLASQSPPLLQESDWEWRPDATLARGGCRVEGADGTGVLAGVEQQLSEIRRTWRENLNDAQIERRNAPEHGQPLRRYPDRREALERA